MMTRRPRFQLSLLSVLLAGLWQAPCVYAQDDTPSNFLDAVGGIAVPAPVPTSPVIPVVEGKAHGSVKEHREIKGPPSLSQPQVSRHDAAFAALQRENRMLRQRLVEKEKADARQRHERIDSRRAADTPEARGRQSALMVKLTTLQGRLDKHIAALKAMTQARDTLAGDVRQLTLSNKALTVKANSGSLAAASGRSTQAALEVVREKLAQAEKRAVVAVQSEDTARARVSALTSELNKLKASTSLTGAEMTRLNQQIKEQIGSQTSTGQELARREALQAQVEALSGTQGQLKTQLVAQDGERRVLQRTITALQGQLALFRQQSTVETAKQASAQAELRTLTEKLAAAQVSLATQKAQSDELEKQRAALAEVEGKWSAQANQLAALQTQLDAAAAANTVIKNKLTMVQAERMQAAAGLSKLQVKYEASTKTNTTLNAQLAALQAEQQRLDTAKGEAGKVAVTRMDELMRTNADLRGQVATLTSARNAAQKSADEAAAALTVAQQRGQADKAQANNAQVAQLAKVQAQLTEVTLSNTALNAQLAARAEAAASGAKQTALAVSPPSSATLPDLNTPQAQQAYASGVMMADLLRRTLALQTDLGEKPDTALLLAGVKDGVTGAVRLDKRVLTTQSEAVVARLSAKEKAKYDSGVKRLEALTAKQTLLKRNGMMFFVQVRKGKRPIKEGESLNISLRESTLSGRVLREGKVVRGVYSAGLPYPVQQALMLGGLGGSIDIYCFASDIYPPNDVPVGIFAYTLMKYTVTTRS